MIFVDTSAWFAAVVPTDSDHPHAERWLAANSEPLLTTDYVVDETLTLLRARGERRRARLLGERFFESSMTEVYFLTEDDIRQAWSVFRGNAETFNLGHDSYPRFLRSVPPRSSGWVRPAIADATVLVAQRNATKPTRDRAVVLGQRFTNSGPA